MAAILTVRENERDVAQKRTRGTLLVRPNGVISRCSMILLIQGFFSQKGTVFRLDPHTT
jgi:hypothetical protein